MKKKVCFLLALVCLCFAATIPVGATATELPASDSADAMYFYHMESGRVVGKKNETTRLSAGASVKLLSGLVACEYLGNRLDESVTIRKEMIEQSTGKRYGLQAGETYTWREILLLALCGSYNDAYDVMAYRIGNGETVGQTNYVDLLNARAKELGATATVVGDPSGVSDNSYTTAYDLSLIARTAAENEQYLSFTRLKSGQLADGSYVYNRNALLSSNSLGGATCAGMCVGETNNAGVTLVALTEKEHDTYILVLMGTKDTNGQASETATNTLATKLIRWGYTNFQNTEILSPSVTVCTLPVTVSDMTDEVSIRPSESLWGYLPSGAALGEDVSLSIRLIYEELEAPITEGTHVGYAAVLYDGQIIGIVALETAESAERSGFMSRLLSIKNLTKSRRAKAGVIFFLVSMSIWIGGETYLKYRTKAKWRQYYASRSKWK